MKGGWISVVRLNEDYINFITPQFSRTHINFQRVPDCRHLQPVCGEGHSVIG